MRKSSIKLLALSCFAAHQLIAMDDLSHTNMRVSRFVRNEDKVSSSEEETPPFSNLKINLDEELYSRSEGETRILEAMRSYAGKRDLVHVTLDEENCLRLVEFVNNVSGYTDQEKDTLHIIINDKRYDKEKITLLRFILFAEEALESPSVRSKLAYVKIYEAARKELNRLFYQYVKTEKAIQENNEQQKTKEETIVAEPEKIEAPTQSYLRKRTVQGLWMVSAATPTIIAIAYHWQLIANMLGISF